MPRLSPEADSATLNRTTSPLTGARQAEATRCPKRSTFARSSSIICGFASIHENLVNAAGAIKLGFLLSEVGSCVDHARHGELMARDDVGE